MEDRSRGHARYHRPLWNPLPTSPPRAPAGRPARCAAEPRVWWPSVAAILAAALVAWAVPLTAVVLVWPILFFVPGWVVIRRVVPDLPLPGAVGRRVRDQRLRLGPPRERRRPHRRVRARLDHRQRGRCWRSAAWSSSPIRHRWLAPAPRARPGPASSPRSGPTARPGSSPPPSAWSSSSSSASTAGRGRPTAGSVGGWNWSDLLVHVAIGSSISAGNFPPEVPYFAGVPLTYHWFADFHGAIASTVAGLDIIPVYFASSALFAARPGARRLGARDAPDRRPAGRHDRDDPRRAPAAGWAGSGSSATCSRAPATPLDLVSRLSYDNTWADGWPYFKIASIFGTGFLPHRATTLGLPGLVDGRAAGRPVPRSPAAGRPAGRRAGRAARAVPVLRLPGDLPDRLPVRRDERCVAGADGRSRRRPVPGAGRPGDPVHRLGRAAPERCRGVPVRGRLGRSALRGRAGGGRVLLPDQPRHPVRARDRRGVHRAGPAESLVPRRLDGGAVRRARTWSS